MRGLFRLLAQHSAGRGFAVRALTGAAKTSVSAVALVGGFWSTGVHSSQNRTKLDVSVEAQKKYDHFAQKNAALLAQIRAHAINNFISSDGKEVICPELIKYCQEGFVANIVASLKPNNAYREKLAVSFTKLALIKMEQEIRSEYKKHFAAAMELVSKQEAPIVTKASKELIAAYRHCQMNTFWFPSEMRCKADARKIGRPAFFSGLKPIEAQDPLIAKAYADAQKAYSEQAYNTTVTELKEDDMVFRACALRS